MKRFILIALTMLMCLSIVSISAADEKGSMAITGTTNTKKGNLAIVKVTASSPIEASSISGTVTYDANNLTIFEVEKSDNLQGWEFKIDKSKSGTITFTGTYSKGGDGPIETERTLFTIKFIVVGSSNSTVSVNATGKGKVKEITVHKGDITNQKEIDEAKLKNENLAEEEEPVVIPEPIYAEKDVTKDVDKNITFDKASLSIKVSNPKSSDTYLKSITVDDATMSPSFSKLTTAYKVTIDEEKEVNINYVKEDEKATVVIQQEVNNQIIMTVTAEDGSTSAYVLTIVRQKNYDSTNPNNPVESEVVVNTENGTPGLLGVDQNTMIMLAGGGAISLIGLMIGTILVIKGKKDMGY